MHFSAKNSDRQHLLKSNYGSDEISSESRTFSKRKTSRMEISIAPNVDSIRPTVRSPRIFFYFY